MGGFLTGSLDLSAVGAAVLDVKAYYRDITTGNDRFEVDVWDGSSWTNQLSWDENHGPEDFTLSLSAYAGLSGVRVRFRYFGNGYDWYAQVDDVALTCVLRPTDTPTGTPTATPTCTPTDTPTPTPTSTPVPEGGTCTETAQCQSGLICIEQVCTAVAAPAPAVSKTGLLIAIGLLAAIGGVAILRRRNVTCC